MGFRELYEEMAKGTQPLAKNTYMKANGVMCPVGTEPTLYWLDVESRHLSSAMHL